MSRRNVLPLVLGLVACAAVLSGCGKPREPVPYGGAAPSASPAPTPAPAKPTPTPSSAPAPAPTSDDQAKPSGDASFSSYARNLTNAPKVAAGTIDTAQLNRAVQQFQAMEGRFPKSLEELVGANYLPALPAAPRGSTLNYNPATGEVTVVKATP